MNATLPAPQKQATENSPIPASPNTQLSPELANRYTPLKELGSGAQGKVFLAIRNADGQKVAIKQLRIDSIKSWKEYTLFHREAETLEKLDIPGVVKFYEACDCLDANPPCSYIVQEYIEGMTLKQILTSGYRFTLDRAYDIFLQILDILEKLHTHNPPVIHRDIKPSNIIIKNLDSNRPKVNLIDFGAVANPHIQSGGSTIAGTFGYMSPEQLIGRPTPQSDTYALAALFTYIISGVDPAEMKTQDLRLIIDPYVENHPVALVQTLRRMLEPDLSIRLSDYNELRRRFNDFKKGIYSLQNEDFKQPSKQEFENRLKNVKNLCQPQNMDLWQTLPDLPDNRPKFPFALWTHPRFAHYPLKKSQNHSTANRFSRILTAIQLISFTIIVIVFVLLAIFIDFIPEVSILIILLLFITSIITIITKNIESCLKSKAFKITSGRLPYINESNHIPKAQCSSHEYIFSNGRKTIATISCIEYCPVSSNEYRVEVPPTYKIYYKFNPPDDDDIDDLYHCITIHRDPEDLFKVGDLLPILYVGTTPNPQAPIHVTKSMPYPFPLDDLETPEDYIGQSV